MDCVELSGVRVDIRRSGRQRAVTAGSEKSQQNRAQSQLQGTMVNSVTLSVTFTILSLHTLTSLADIYFGNQGDYG